MSELALEILYDDVVAHFASRMGSAAPEQPFGWREPEKRLAGRRIVWVPGDDGDVGAVLPAKKPGRNPRPLYTIEELCTVFVEAYDTSAPEDERMQYRAVRLLLDAFLAALYLSAHPRVQVLSQEYVTDKKLRRAGATIRLVLSIEAMVPDAPLTETTATEATTTVTLLDVTETATTETP